MIFCLNYYPHQKYIEQAEELKIKYRPSDKTLQAFLQKYQDKSIIITVSDSFGDVDLKLFKGLREKYKNFKLVINYYNKELIKMVKEAEIPFFFKNFATTADQMAAYSTYCPTDMYICEELGFHLDKISETLHSLNIKIRVLPNICQSNYSEIPSIKTFFIRPEDIIYYRDYVDVLEPVSDKMRQETIFRVYKERKWFGKINELIPTFVGDLDSKYVMPSFGLVRSRCGRRCMYKPSSCGICDRFIDLANTFEEKGVVIVTNASDAATS